MRAFRQHVAAGRVEEALELALRLSKKIGDDHLLDHYVGNPGSRFEDEAQNLEFFRKAIECGWRGKDCAGRAMAIVAYTYQAVSFGNAEHIEESSKLIKGFMPKLSRMKEIHGYKKGRFYLTFSLLIAALHKAVRTNDRDGVAELIDYFREQLGEYQKRSDPQRSWQMFTQPIGIMALDCLVSKAHSVKQGEVSFWTPGASAMYEKFLLEALRAKQKDYIFEKRRTLRFALVCFGTPQDDQLRWEVESSSYLRYVAASAFLRVEPDDAMSQSLESMNGTL